MALAGRSVIGQTAASRMSAWDGKTAVSDETTVEEMQAELQAMRDRQAIVDLTIRYTWLLDHGPRSDLTSVFTEDAFALLGRECHGVQAIIERVEQALGPLDISQHILGNHQVSIDGDQATSRCYFHAQHVVRDTEGGDNWIVAGRYEDELTRTPAGWRIHHRVLTTDWVDGNPNIFTRS